MLYKGYKSSVNYDGEPSVSNGIVYQLPSSHLLIHRVPAKLSNRVIALRSELLQATALVYILILLTCPFRRVRIFRGRFPCFVTCWSLCWCSACCTPSLSGFFPEPCPISESSATRQGSGINNAVDCLMLQSLPSFPAAWCPSASSSDHRPFPSSESYKRFSKACRLSQSVTASFSADCQGVSCSTHGVI